LLLEAKPAFAWVNSVPVGCGGMVRYGWGEMKHGAVTLHTQGAGSRADLLAHFPNPITDHLLWAVVGCQLHGNLCFSRKSLDRRGGGGSGGWFLKQLY